MVSHRDYLRKALVPPYNMTWNDPPTLDRLRTAIGHAKYCGPVAETDITSAEVALGVRFPTSYRVFLKHFGAVWLPSSYEIAGLGPGRCTDPAPPLWAHVVDVTIRTRQVSQGFIPEAYIRFSDNGGDCAFYLDTGASDANGECPVVVLGPGYDRIIIALSFIEFVEGAVASRLTF